MEASSRCVRPGFCRDGATKRQKASLEDDGATEIAVDADADADDDDDDDDDADADARANADAAAADADADANADRDRVCTYVRTFVRTYVRTYVRAANFYQRPSLLHTALVYECKSV